LGLLDRLFKQPGPPPPASDVELFGQVDERGIFYAPHLMDPTTKRQAARGTVKKWHHEIGRSMVSGQRILEVDTEIGPIPIRTRINGNLAEIFVQPGEEVVPGKALWRYVVSRQVGE
jgi:hypothetical protein